MICHHSGMYHGTLFCSVPSAIFPRRSLIRFPSIHSKYLFRRNRSMDSNDATNGKDRLKRRSVAGSFLFKIPDGLDKPVQVALFRRSGKVSTYQHKLAPISGSVEKNDASPYATALREINEETGLTLSSIELLRVGKPYTFIDESIGREWTINPFGFRLKEKIEGGKGEDGITIDWEHDGFQWFDPLQVRESDEFGGVPKLVNSLRRVWPEYDLGRHAGKAFTFGLQRLRDDHESGARQLAEKALSILKTLILEMKPDVIDDTWWANVRMAAWHICKARESMGAAITTAIVKALDQIEAVINQDIPPPEKLRQMIESIDDQLTRRKSTTDYIRDTFINYLRQNVIKTTEPKKTIRVLTLSSSSTISACLLQAAANLGVSLDLRILESRPLCEGVALASKLLKLRDESIDFTVTLYTDASMALAADAVDVVVLGADRISATGDVSNKIGSLPVVLSQRHVAPNAKVVILSETEKIACPGLAEEHTVEDNDPAEVTQAWRKDAKSFEVIEDVLTDTQSNATRNIQVRNTYFEWVPAHFIHGYLTDEGLWSVQDIAKRSSWIGDEMDRFFKNL
ncbi:nagb/rpia/CoA transferase-like protein [Annulohypoxylon maeteangense]|uniref:nagb/rpia/CoA transferase-like protein n=1 Tax=Annulohypoxylon maeteangense TaxID=1927788 RepID=UPI002007E77F|nr:nagb/rpia/CoA transferase-like protein [Annulohypoxylon maeteangense]KAI0887693.1 nagb/rpia/CoA transferase-like protein [Annulohypoxylon maeteangense]